MCHHCLGLCNDIPNVFFTDKSLFYRTDSQETHCRTFSFDYFSTDPLKYYEYSSSYYGYYFKVLYTRMQMMRNNDNANSASCPRPPASLYIQVTSDSNLTPQLKMLGSRKCSHRRPVWGSAIVYELLHTVDAQLFSFFISYCLSYFLSG